MLCFILNVQNQKSVSPDTLLALQRTVSFVELLGPHGVIIVLVVKSWTPLTPKCTDPLPPPNAQLGSRMGAFWYAGFNCGFLHVWLLLGCLVGTSTSEGLVLVYVGCFSMSLVTSGLTRHFRQKLCLVDGLGSELGSRIVPLFTLFPCKWWECRGLHSEKLLWG